MDFIYDAAKHLRSQVDGARKALNRWESPLEPKVLPEPKPPRLNQKSPGETGFGAKPRAAFEHQPLTIQLEPRAHHLPPVGAVHPDSVYARDILAQEVTRGMREAASRGFWMTTN